ncbi:MAG TPA: hypothetical protein DCR55_04565 [Lentisphaeria bacterium]|nr:hypothetical protein [Lentisphaeria bacterium]
MAKSPLIILLCLAACLTQADVPYPAGQQTNIRQHGLMHPYLRVYTPKAYDARIAYPIMFWFGQPDRFPDIGPAALAHRGHGFIAVGMSYPKDRDGNPILRFQDNWRTCEATMSHLRRFLNIDEKRVYVGGLRAGAMVAAEISWQRPGAIAGAVILKPGLLPQEAPLYHKELAILVGTGELDYEFAAAQSAISLFSRLGGVVTYHEWRQPDQPYAATGRLIDWLDLQVLRGTDKERDFVESWIRARISDAHGMKAWQKFLALHRLGGDPRIPFARPTTQAHVAALLNQATANALIGDTLYEGSQFRKLVRQEVELMVKGVEASLLQELALQYRDLHHKFEDSPFGIRAVVAETRAWSVYERLLHQQWNQRQAALDKMRKELQGLSWRQTNRPITFTPREYTRLRELQRNIRDEESTQRRRETALKAEQEIVQPLLDVFHRRPAKEREPFVLAPLGGLTK